MIPRPADFLIATAAFAWMGTIGAAIALIFGKRSWSLAIARTGMAGGAVCGMLLAVLLTSQAGDAASVQVMLWKWISFSNPQAPSITLGLEANLIKSSLVGLFGLLALIALWNADSIKRPFSDDLILSISCLYSVAIFFAFAPNLPQSLMGWGAIGLLAGILIRLAHQKPETNQVQSEPGLKPRTTIGSAANPGRHPIVPVIMETTRLLEWVSRELGQWLIRRLPNWFIEQLDIIDQGPAAVQILATILGASAILLTWLVASGS